MPALSMFYGIIIYMYREKGSQHNRPHIHAIYGDEEVVVALDGEIVEGSINRKKQKLLDAWMVLHADELEANWKLLSDGEPAFKIDPLR